MSAVRDFECCDVGHDEGFRAVYEPEPFTPPSTSGFLRPKPMNPVETQRAVEGHLLALGKLVASLPGQQLNLTDEFMERLAEGQPALSITSDRRRCLTILRSAGGHGTVLLGEASEG